MYSFLYQSDRALSALEFSWSSVVADDRYWNCPSPRRSERPDARRPNRLDDERQTTPPKVLAALRSQTLYNRLKNLMTQ
jgi:hypothetical protein